MDRRKFIKNSTSFIALPFLLNGQVVQVLAANGLSSSMETNGKKLVLIQLDGGNDGLNTLIPLDMYQNLVKVRPQVVLPENKILPLTSTQGLHPSMEKMQHLFQDEKLMFIQNVAYPQPNLSHFRSKEIVLSASDSQTVVSSGWFGRYLEILHPEYPDNYPSVENPHPLAITIGNTNSPTCQGEMNSLGVVLQKLSTSYQSGSENQNFPDTPYGNELKFVSGVMQKTEKYLEVVSETADLSETLSQNWPENNGLADKLKIVARLISGGLNTPIYIVNLGGFDTHAKQVFVGETDTGKHADLMKLLSEAVFAFQSELQLQNKEDEVLGLIYSEFGRRIASNKTYGTDHGVAYPMMLFGSKINPVVYGQNPQINSEVESKDNVPMEFDFRRVYASLLKDWLELGETDVSSVLFQEFEYIPILKSSVGTNEYLQNSKEFRIDSVYPNPILDNASIQIIHDGGFVKLELWNSSGQKIRSIMEGKVPKGKHIVQFQKSGLAKGTYYLVLSNSTNKFTQAISIQ